MSEPRPFERGNTISVVSPSAISEGDVVVVGTLVGFALHDAAEGAGLALYIEGVAPRAAARSAEAWAIGDAIFYHMVDDVFTKTQDGGNTVACGFAIASKAPAAAVGRVRLEPATPATTVTAANITGATGSSNNSVLGRVGAGNVGQLAVTGDSLLGRDGNGNLSGTVKVKAGHLAEQVVSAGVGIGVPFTIEVDATDDAAAISVFENDAPFKFRILDAMFVATASNLGGSAVLNNGNDDIHTPVTMAAEGAITRATAGWVRARAVIDAGETLRVVKNGSSDQGFAVLTCVRVA